VVSSEFGPERHGIPRATYSGSSQHRGAQTVLTLKTSFLMYCSKYGSEYDRPNEWRRGKNADGPNRDIFGGNILIFSWRKTLDVISLG
jgi:hypothetical protein